MHATRSSALNSQRQIESRGRLAGAAALALLAVLLAWLPLERAVLLAGGAAAGILTLRRPWLLWLGLGALLPFAAALDLGPATALDLLLGAAVALWFVDGVRRDELGLALGAPLAAAATYVLVLLVSSLQALDFGQALTEVVKWAEFAAVLALLPVMLWARGAAEGASTVAGRVRWVAAGIVAGAAAQAVLGIYQFIFRIGPDWFVVLGRFMRASGSFGQPNPFAGYMGLVLPVAVSLTLAAWADWGRTRGELRWALYWSGASALIGAGLLASWSRGGWLGAAAALAAVVVLRSRRAALLGAGVALLVLGALLLGMLSPGQLPNAVVAPVAERLAELPAFFGFFGSDALLQQEVTDENFALIERVAHWVAAQRMFADSPWFGVGAGSYAAAYPAFRIARWEEALGHAHNAYLNTLAEVGIVGAAAVALLWGSVVIWLARALRGAASTHAPASTHAHASRFGRALVVGVLGVLVHLAVHSLVDNLFVQGMYVTLALWPALVAAGNWPHPRGVRDTDTGNVL